MKNTQCVLLPKNGINHPRKTMAVDMGADALLTLVFRG